MSCWLQLSHGKQMTSSTGLTMLSSKAWLGPRHWGGGTCHFLPETSAAQVHNCPSWVEFHCHDLDSHQERSRSFSKVQDNPTGQLLKSYRVPSIVLGPGQAQRRPTPPNSHCTHFPESQREREEKGDKGEGEKEKGEQCVGTK